MKNPAAKKQCPLCEVYTERNAAKCPTCGSIFIDGGENVKTTGLSKSEMSSRISAARKRVRLYSLLTYLFIITGFFGIGLLGRYVKIDALGGFALLFFISTTISCYAKGFLTKRVLDKLIKVNIVNEILAETFELESYLPGGRIPNSQIDKSGLIGGWSWYTGSDLVRGKYKGVPVEFCDVALAYDGIGSENKSYAKTTFKGQWLEIGLKKPVSSAVYLAERTGEIGATSVDVKTQVVKTESDAFNKKYKILAQDPTKAFYVLTPHFMEYIIAADNAADSITYFCFAGNRVRIAMKNGRDLFDFGKLKKSMTLDWFRARITSDVRNITGVIDELLRNEYLFGLKISN